MTQVSYSLNIGEFSGDYSPGGLTGKSLERAKRGARCKAARKAGRASGRRRRQLARARRANAGLGDSSLPLSYEQRQPSRAEFDSRYESVFPEPESPQGAAQWERGRETVWAELMGSWRLVKARGQHCRTTKPQRAQALAKRDRPRCTRTVRRLHQRLEQLGYATYSHRRAPRGRKDCLVIEWRLQRRLPVIDVTPPSGTVNPGLRPGGSPPSRQEIPPPTAADDDVGPPADEHQGTLESEVERRIRFLEMKLAAGWATGRIRMELAHCRQELRAIAGPESRQSDRPDSDGRCSEPSSTDRSGQVEPE